MYIAKPATSEGRIAARQPATSSLPNFSMSQIARIEKKAKPISEKAEVADPKMSGLKSVSSAMSKVTTPSSPRQRIHPYVTATKASAQSSVMNLKAIAFAGKFGAMSQTTLSSKGQPGGYCGSGGFPGTATWLKPCPCASDCAKP